MMYFEENMNKIYIEIVGLIFVEIFILFLCFIFAIDLFERIMYLLSFMNISFLIFILMYIIYYEIKENN